MFYSGSIMTRLARCVKLTSCPKFLKYVYSLAKNYNTDEKILDTLALAEDNGVNTVVVHNVPATIKLLKKHVVVG